MYRNLIARLILNSGKSFPKNKLLTNLARKSGFELRKFINYDSIIDKKIINKRETTYSYSPPNFSLDSNNKIINFQRKDLFDYELFNVEIIGNSNLILTNNDKAIYNYQIYDVKKKIKYTDGGILKYNNEYCLIKYQEAVNLDTGIKFSSNFNWNYYHLVLESLAKFFYLDKLKINKNIPILIDSVVNEIPQYKELLNLLNIEQREIIFIEKGKKYFIKKLYHLTDSAICPPNFTDLSKIRPCDILIDLQTINFIRNKLLKLKKNNFDFSNKIFLSRNKASNRRKYNEDEVWEVLKDYGFDKVFPEDMSIIEQVTLFNNAKIIVGTTGAAFTNLIFSKPNTKIICFTNYNLPLSFFSTLAAFNGAQMYYLYDKNINYKKSNILNSSFNVDIVELKNILKKIVLEYAN